MSNIRVLICDAPTMLRDILKQAISNQPDMEVIPEPAVSTRAEADEQLSPDVVVAASVSKSDLDERARALLMRWPESHVLMITTRGHKVLRYELLAPGIDLGEMSPDRLVQAIRATVHPKHKHIDPR